METGLKLTAISFEDMLERKEQAYNPRVWKQAVTKMNTYPRCKFYLIEPEGTPYSYTRFFVTYIADGIHFFSDFSAFSAGLSNNGFCKVQIYGDGTVQKFMFKSEDGKEGYAENCKENRTYFRNELTPYGIMVSNCI